MKQVAEHLYSTYRTMDSLNNKLIAETNYMTREKLTPEEKAEEIVNKYCTMFYDEAVTQWTKNCAIILVDEIIDIESSLGISDFVPYGVSYWMDVKKAIENL